MATGSYDYIVVGAGTAGCVVAARLSERGASVLLLDMGISDTANPEVADTIARPENVLKAIWSESISRQYWTTRQPGLGHRSMMVHRGVVRGGCSSIHGMIYVRGNPRDYDLWAKLGNPGWNYKDVLPYFRKSENYVGGASAYHGVGGPLDVRDHPTPSKAALAFIDSAASLGYKKSSPTWDFNGAQQENAAGLYQVNVTSMGRRASSAVAFLDGLPGKGALVTRTGMCVKRICIEGGRAVGVECFEGGSSTTYRAEREVIVSCGAFESPKLLMLSGIGPAEHLKQHGIKPVANLPGVGQNLHDHLQILVYHMARRDVGVSEFTAEAGLFVNTSGADTPDLQYHVLAGMIGLAEDPKPRPNFLMCPVLAQPKSRGTVQLASADPRCAPLIDPKFLEEPADVKVLLHGLDLMEDLALSGGLGDLIDTTAVPFAVPDPLKPTEHLPLTLRVARASFVRATAVTVWHPVGTCKMGQDELAVVDPELRVRSVEGLRVADASIMPRITSGNTNAACFMIGEVCAAAIP